MRNIPGLQVELKALKEREPNLRIREQADHLKISEVERLGLELGDRIEVLVGDYKALLKRIPEIGQVIVITRNEYCVHELTGTYNSIQFKEGHEMGIVANEKIDLRFLMKEWEYALAVSMTKGIVELFSFQFFDKYGTAVHKIFTRKGSNIDAYKAIKQDFLAEYQVPMLIYKGEKPSGKGLNEKPAGLTAFHKAWKSLKHTHDFYGFLKRFKVSRLTALENAPIGYAIKVGYNKIEQLLTRVVKEGIRIMTLVESPGCVQIKSGRIHNLKYVEKWFNILDPGFSLHLDTSGVNQVWVVRKHTDYGIITSLEVYDASGELILTFYGERNSGGTELPEWRNAIDSILDEEDW